MSDNTYEFEGKLAVVCLAVGAISAAPLALELARRGAQVALSYHGSNPTAVIDAITALGKAPIALKVDAMDTTGGACLCGCGGGAVGQEDCKSRQRRRRAGRAQAHGGDGRCLLGPGDDG